MYRVLHRIDAIVDPIICQLIRLRGDPMSYRMHRLTVYASAAAWPLLNQRVHPHYDFRELPRSLRLRLVVGFHGLWIFLFLLVTGFVALELTK